MSYAIIQTGGKQYRVEPGRFYDVELLSLSPTSNLTITDVLLVNGDGTVSIGQPLVEGATVEVTVMQHLKAKKVIVYKMQPKKKTRKKNGHRQSLTRILVESINFNGQIFESSAMILDPQEEPEEEMMIVETQELEEEAIAVTAEVA